MTTDGNDMRNIHDDEFIARLYEHIADQRASDYAAAYDTDAGLARFTGWLRDNTAADEPDGHYSAGTTLSETAVAVAIKASADAIPVSLRPLPPKLELTAEEAVTQLYTGHYRSLVRLAVLLVRDEPTAEEVVQECFIAMHDGWHRLREEDKALSYLKQAVVNRSKSVLRHRSVVDRNAPKPAPDMPSAEHGAMSLLERSAVITALRGLPDRQRQALVLRYYADMSEAQIADMMGISKGAVKSHTARGMSSLRAVLEQTS
jgi:RNA polymerase sigma-70 factor (sigma-E family)